MRLPHYGIKILGPVFSCRNDELIHVCKLQKIDGSWQMGCISCSLLVRTPARAGGYQPGQTAVAGVPTSH